MAYKVPKKRRLAKGGRLTSAKARKILHDKEVRGKPLTGKQRRFFGAIAGGQRPRKKGGR